MPRKLTYLQRVGLTECIERNKVVFGGITVSFTDVMLSLDLLRGAIASNSTLQYSIIQKVSVLNK